MIAKAWLNLKKKENINTRSVMSIMDESFDTRPIGIFDSGVGGLTVAQAICQHLPLEKLIYYGDTARTPWGDQSPQVIQTYVQEITQFLIAQNCKAIVIACNTAASVALETVLALTEPLRIPVIHVIDPVIDYLKQTLPPDSTVALIGTHQTIQSKTYEQALLNLNLNLNIYTQATPLLCPLIEAGLQNHPHWFNLILKTYFHGTDRASPSQWHSLILACTHYPLLKKKLSECFEDLNIIDSTTLTAQALAKSLAENKILAGAQSEKFPRCTLYLSQKTPYFKTLAEQFFQSQGELIILSDPDIIMSLDTI